MGIDGASRLGTAGHPLFGVSVWRYALFNTNATATTLASTLLCMVESSSNRLTVVFEGI
jgi:hypothetical protein